MAAQTENKVDVALYARSGTAVERSFAASDLPRLVEAGAGPGSAITVNFQFFEHEGRPAIGGDLTGTVSLECQRCLGDVEVRLEERFDVIVVREEAELAGEPGGYEPVLVDPARLDLRWLAEEQALLALPLVAMHEPDECVEKESEPDAGREEQPTQRPFENLRDLLRKA